MTPIYHNSFHFLFHYPTITLTLPQYSHSSTPPSASADLLSLSIGNPYLIVSMNRGTPLNTPNSIVLFIGTPNAMNSGTPLKTQDTIALCIGTLQNLGKSPHVSSSQTSTRSCTIQASSGVLGLQHPRE